MSTPERRIDVLRRQRALVQQNLAWLDREIAAEQVQTDSSTPLPATSAPAPVLPTDRASIPDADAEAILRQYQTDEKSVATDVRQGCLLYAVGAFALMVALVLGLYFLLRH